MQPGRRWSDGLHQAIEAKENVSIQKNQKQWQVLLFKIILDFIKIVGNERNR